MQKHSFIPMHWFRLPNNFCTILLIGTLLAPIQSNAESIGRIGLTIGVSQRAGALASSQPIVAPALCFESRAYPNLRIEAEYLAFSVDAVVRKISFSRATLWVERKARFSLAARDFELFSGIGWSFLHREGGSDRGSLGFRAGLAHPFSAWNGRSFDVGLRYTGTPWAGSGGVEDRLELQLRAFLFGKPTELNSVP